MKKLFVVVIKVMCSGFFFSHYFLCVLHPMMCFHSNFKQVLQVSESLIIRGHYCTIQGTDEEVLQKVWWIMFH